MVFRSAAACLLALVLVPSCQAAGTKTKAKAKDPWDVPEGGGEEMEAAPAGATESDMSPDDQAGMIAQVEQRSAVRRAHNQHAVMKQFMSTFANNMRLSVLADSQGDMPEERRQQLIAQAEAAKQKDSGEAPGSGPPPEADGGDEMSPPPPPRRRLPRHMLNMAEARRQRMRHSPRLLPEAEGIGFPAPEGMATDPATDGMVNDPGMTSNAGPAEFDEAPAPRRQAPRRQRHHVRMLNMRPGQHRKAFRQPDAHKGAHAHTLPPGVVRDEMGRAMPLLFIGKKPSHSGAPHVARTPLATIAAIACLFLAYW